ncbi:MAG: DUF58 domain-containing protein [Phycisphaerae bacterium]|jgi:uncharacterized protein (DUF58 family)
MTDYRKYLRPEVLAKISRLELRARMVVEGFISGMHKSPYQGFSVEFAAHREYVPGDDIRHIDWRLFGRGDRLYIKQYEEETNLRTHILLDCSRSMAYPDETAERVQGSRTGVELADRRQPPSGAGRMTKYQYACTVAASLVYLLMRQQDACGLVLFDHKVREQAAPASSHAHLRSLIEMIERHPPDHATNVKMLLPQLAEHIRQRSVIVLISDLLTSMDDLIAGLQRLRYTRHDVIVLHVLDDDEINFPFQDNTLFEGLERPNVRFLVDPQALRASYLQIVENFVRRVRSACMDHRIDYALLSTREPLDAALATYLAGRMHRLAK